MPPFSLIAAISNGNGAIGQQGRMPWPVLEADRHWFRLLTTAQEPERMAYHLTRYPHTIAFAQGKYNQALWTTDRNAVIMGRKTYQSLPAPLAGRDMYVISRSLLPTEPYYWLLETFTQALEQALENLNRHIWVIGGAAVYSTALQHPDCQTLYLTEVEGTYPEADTFWPESRIDWDAGRMQTWGDTRNKARTWHRTHSSAWITEPDRPRYRFGIWAPV